MYCIDCKSKDNLIKFKQDDRDVYICKECLNDKIDKGNKKHNSYVCNRKHFIFNPHSGQK